MTDQTESKSIRNLYNELMEAADLETDRRFKAWAKRVDRVDTNATNGYAFVGPFINDGTVEVEHKPSVYLVMAESGSAKYHYAYYRVVVMDDGGQLSKTDIATNSKESGWALRIRNQVAELLKAISKPAPAPEPKFSLDDDNLIIHMPDGSIHNLPRAIFETVAMLPADARQALLSFLATTEDFVDA